MDRGPLPRQTGQPSNTVPGHFNNKILAARQCLSAHPRDPGSTVSENLCPSLNRSPPLPSLSRSASPPRRQSRCVTARRRGERRRGERRRGERRRGERRRGERRRAECRRAECGSIVRDISVGVFLHVPPPVPSALMSVFTGLLETLWAFYVCCGQMGQHAPPANEPDT
ncbi:hypothetical protein COCON_G00042860 [Conger conger]|uniref:Uncharacterized protein n=1 Tax=Conger conger TaxID=82655 RepID=A0A9Q1DTY0_CONCO|nr:hypothetical protein COCON_G00042860 [Conger conger]